MAPYPYLTLHIASSLDSDQDEAQDHADSFSPKGEVRSAGNADELYQLFLDLGRQGAQLAYMDFHCHGYPGGLSLGKGHLEYSDLAQFRRGGLDGLFRGNAVISFLSCNLGASRFDKEHEGEDGELFLAEFAYIFLRRNGGSAFARNKDWHYRPSTLWSGPRFKNDGAEIVAEVAPGASRAVLKGQFRLDEQRIKSEITVLRSFIAAALDSLPGPQVPQSYREDRLVGPATKMIADGVRRMRSEQIAKNRGVYTRCIQLLDQATANIRTLTPDYWLKYDKACQAIELVVESLASIGVPLGHLMPPILNTMHIVPVSR